MAADKEVIRQFLVSLGYAIDQTGARKFDSALSRTGKQAVKAAAVIAGVAAAAEAMVQIFAGAMEKLYYSSRRTHASVANIQALQFGAEQIGISAEEAQGALEGMSRAMRLNPALTGLLKSLGIKSEGRDRVYVLNDLVQRLSKMPHFVGAQYAQMFGIDEQTLLMMKDKLPQLIAAEEKRRQMNRAAGVDADAAAAASREYMNSLRELWTQLGVLKDRLAIELLPIFRKFTSYLNDAIASLTRWASGGFKLGDLSKFNADLASLLGHLAELYKMLQAKPGENWLASVAHVLATMNVRALESLLKFVDSIASFLSGDFETAGSQARGALESMADMALARDEQTKKDIAELNANEAKIAMQNLPTSQRKELEGLTSGLSRLARGGAVTIAQVASQFAPSGAAGAGYAGNLAARMGVSPEMALNIANPATMARLMSAMLTQQRGVAPYGISTLYSAAQAAAPGLATGGAGSVVLHQKTEINVHSTDPTTAARAVGREQRRVNADLTRNFAGAVR